MRLKVVCLICKKQIFNKKLNDDEMKKQMIELLKNYGKYVIIKNVNKQKVGGFVCEKCYNKIFEAI